jgi:NAD(P)H-flavin reductase
VFLVERLTREIVGRETTAISKIIQHPSMTMEVQIKKPSCKTKAGQYVFICCPEISPFEWHPFTLTSSPHEDFIGVHIRIVGDWTEKFARRCGYNFDDDSSPSQLNSLPYLMVDGSYGYATSLFNKIVLHLKTCLIMKFLSS